MKRDAVILALGGLLGLMVLVPAHAESKTVTLDVPSMYCEACPITVSKALKKVNGVEKVAASFEKRQAVVTFDDARTNIDTLRKATANAGYPSTLKQ
jgi:mercuric ion binding protein